MLKCWTVRWNISDIPSIWKHETIADYLQNWKHCKIRLIHMDQPLHFLYILKMNKNDCNIHCVSSDEQSQSVPLSVGFYTTQLLHWAYNLCSIICSLELLRAKAVPLFLWKTQDLVLRTLASDISMYLKTPCTKWSK